MSISRTDFELVERFGNIHPDTLDGIVDSDPTLASWSSIPGIIDDMSFVTRTMAAAYDAAVYSLGRHKRGDPNAVDLPVGAAIGDPSSGTFYQGFAQDKELDDSTAHAEVMALRHFKRVKSQSGLGGLTLAATFEPCPACLGELEDSGVSRVVFGASRSELENSSILKPHNLKAPDIIRKGRETGRYLFEFFKFPHPAIQAACIEIFASFDRNVDTEKVVFDDNFTRATRYNLFADRLNDQRSPAPSGPDAPRRPQQEIVAMYDGFLEVTDSFSRRVSS